MALKKSSTQGKVNVSMAAIAAITANAAMECYGVVGLAGKSVVRDNIAELLRKENNIYPSYRMIDTAPVENERYVPYFYSTYNGKSTIKKKETNKKRKLHARRFRSSKKIRY